MASPHVAGAAALLKEAQPSLSASRFRDVLENSADPADWFGFPGVGLIEAVHRQGAGMVDIDDAINATTTIVPGQALARRESGRAGHTNADADQPRQRERDVRPRQRRRRSATGPETFPPLTFWLPETQVVFSAPSVTVPAHGSAAVSARITVDPIEDNIPTGGLYGGYLVLQDRANADSVFTVPYGRLQGRLPVDRRDSERAGDRQAEPAVHQGAADLHQADANEVWTLQSPDEIPNVLIHFDHQVRHLELAGRRRGDGQAGPSRVLGLPRAGLPRAERLRPPANGPYNTDPNNDDVTAFPWDGTRMHDNGNGTPDHRKVVPDGSYKIVVKALKARR